MEKMIKDRIVKQMVWTWGVIIILLAFLLWAILHSLGFSIFDSDFSGINFASANIYTWVFVVIFIVLLFWLIRATVNSLQYRKILGEFYIMNNMSKKAVEEEFAKAVELINNYWVTPVLTIYYDGNVFGIVKNAKLSEVRASVMRGTRGATAFFLELYNRDHDRIVKLNVNYDYQKILDYYRENCPHIMLNA